MYSWMINHQKAFTKLRSVQVSSKVLRAVLKHKKNPPLMPDTYNRYN